MDTRLLNLFQFPKIKSLNSKFLWVFTCFLSFFPLTAMSSYPTQLRAVIFDCDGVLVDTEYLKFLAWEKALEIKNIPFCLEEYLPLIGHSSKNILNRIRENKQLDISDQIIEIRNHHYQVLQRQGVPPIQKMVDFALHLSKHKDDLGIYLAVASSAPKEEILSNLHQIGLEDIFDCIISGSDDLDSYADVEGTNKPKPYIYMETAKQLCVSPEQCLVFEDTAAGIHAAVAAGMNAIAIPNQFTLDQDFSRANAIFSHEELFSFETIYKVYQHVKPK